MPKKPDFAIAAAADLRYALDEIAEDFQARHPSVTVKIVYGSSGHFYAQIEHGAPYDVYCSADLSIANPGHAPYGKAAVAAMRHIGVYDAVKSKLAYGENVSQAIQFVQSGSAQIGIVALSLALAPPESGSRPLLGIAARLISSD